MTNSAPIRTGFTLVFAVLAAAGSLVARGAASRPPVTTLTFDHSSPAHPLAPVHEERLAYRTRSGRVSHATLLLPRDYDPRRDAALPLVISPHGRGLDGDANARLWGDLPARGRFAVVNPDGAGERLRGRFSWGAPDDIADLARMPEIVERTLGVRIDRRRVYAVGGSMGAQETLLLVARYPRLLAGAVAVDAPADFARQYRNFARLECDALCHLRWHGPVGRALQRLARREVGGSPATAPAAFAERSPLTYAAELAGSAVPLQIWWSRNDQVILQSRLQSGRLAAEIRRLNPAAPLTVVTGGWPHTHVLRYDRKLPQMLAGLGLLDLR